MNGLMARTPSPIAARLAVAATTLPLLVLLSVLGTPGIPGGLKVISGVVVIIASVAIGFALFGRWPSTTRTWSARNA